LLSTDSLSATPAFNQHQQPDQYNDRIKSHLKAKEEKKDLSYLVMMRERKKGVRTVFQKCMLVAERGAITKQSPESISLSQLVLLCLQSLEDSMKSGEDYSQIMRLEKSNEDSTSDMNNDDDYRDDNHYNGYHNHEDISSNQSGLNRIENNSKNINRYHDNYDHNNDDNDEKKENLTTAGEEQLCNEGNRRARLAEKLLEHPETYLAVLDILGNVRYCTCTS
jgi:hypothetical protein